MKNVFANRSTIDIVVLAFTLLICVCLLVMIIGAILGKLVHPEMEMPNIVEAVTLTLSSLVGAVIGFIGGRAYGRAEQITNGTPPP